MFFFVNTKFSWNKISDQSSQSKTSTFLRKHFSKLPQKNKKIPLSLKALDFPNSGSKKLIRLNTDETIQKIIINLQKISDEKNFFDFCLTNREHLSYCLLYRLTALKLKTESDSKNGDQTKNIENFRKKILENILFIDQPVSQALILSEKRIKEIMESSMKESLILNKIGEDVTSVTCFWIVMQAALLAWKKKDESENLETKTEIYEKLKKIQTVFSNSRKHNLLLSHELLFLQKSLYENSNFSVSDEKNEQDLIEGLKILISQLEKLPSNSYGPLLEKTLEICNQILEKKFGSKIENLDKFKIIFPLNPIETDSKLI